MSKAPTKSKVQNRWRRLLDSLMDFDVLASNVGKYNLRALDGGLVDKDVHEWVLPTGTRELSRGKTRGYAYPRVRVTRRPKLVRVWVGSSGQRVLTASTHK